MTFLQWCANARIRSNPLKMALEEIWNDYISAGCDPKLIARRFNELMESLGRER
jgi:hypothetical protein